MRDQELRDQIAAAMHEVASGKITADDEAHKLLDWHYKVGQMLLRWVDEDVEERDKARAEAAELTRERDLLLRLHAEAAWRLKHKAMYERAYFDVQRVLDEALGAEEEDGAGGGIAGDVWLLGEKLRRAEAMAGVLADQKREAEASRRDWAAEALRLEHIAEMMVNAVAMNDDRLRFVARRYLADGSGANFRNGRCTGLASDALAWFAVGRRDEPQLGEYPADESDLAACERTYEMAPEFLRERMLPVLERYRSHVSRPVCAVHPEGGQA